MKCNSFHDITCFKNNFLAIVLTFEGIAAIVLSRILASLYNCLCGSLHIVFSDDAWNML